MITINDVATILRGYSREATSNVDSPVGELEEFTVCQRTMLDLLTDGDVSAWAVRVKVCGQLFMNVITARELDSAVDRVSLLEGAGYKLARGLWDHRT